MLVELEKHMRDRPSSGGSFWPQPQSLLWGMTQAAKRAMSRAFDNMPNFPNVNMQFPAMSLPSLPSLPSLSGNRNRSRSLDETLLGSLSPLDQVDPGATAEGVLLLSPRLATATAPPTESGRRRPAHRRQRSRSTGDISTLWQPRLRPFDHRGTRLRARTSGQESVLDAPSFPSHACTEQARSEKTGVQHTGAAECDAGGLDDAGGAVDPSRSPHGHDDAVARLRPVVSATDLTTVAQSDPHSHSHSHAHAHAHVHAHSHGPASTRFLASLVPPGAATRIEPPPSATPAPSPPSALDKPDPGSGLESKQDTSPDVARLDIDGESAGVPVPQRHNKNAAGTGTERPVEAILAGVGVIPPTPRTVLRLQHPQRRTRRDQQAQANRRIGTVLPPAQRVLPRLISDTCGRRIPHLPRPPQDVRSCIMLALARVVLVRPPCLTLFCFVSSEVSYVLPVDACRHGKS